MTRERIHSVTGVFPLSAYLLLHVYETSAVASGRDAFVAGLHDRVLVLAVLFVLLPLAVHALLGVSLWLRPAPGGPGAALASPSSLPLRALQRVSGVLVLGFLVLHLGHTFALGAAGLEGAAIYGRLRADLGTPLYLGAYVVGIAAMSLHLAIGLPAAARRFGLARSAVAFSRARWMAAALAVLLFAVSVNTLSHFVVGAAILGGAPGGAP